MKRFSFSILLLFLSLSIYAVPHVLNSDQQLISDYTSFSNTFEPECTAENLKLLINLRDTINSYQKSDLYLFSHTQNTNDVFYIDKMLSDLKKAIEACKMDDEEQLQISFNSMQSDMIDFLGAFNESNNKSRGVFFQIFAALFFLIFLVLVLTVLIYRKSKQLNKMDVQAQTSKIEAEKDKLITESIISAQEDERERISHELHDTVTQDIRTIQLFTRELEPFINITPVSQDYLNKVKTLEANNLTNIRQIITNLLLPELDSINFSTCLSNFCSNCSSTNNIPCNFSASSSSLLESLPKNKKHNIYRIIQEAVTNAIKHAKATEISVIVRETYYENNKTVSNLQSGKVIIIVSDDGCGMEATQGNTEGTKIGIKGIESRASILGAKLLISSDSETGTEVRLEIPVNL